MERKSLGEFEHLVLAAVLHLGEDAYGVSIATLVEQRIRRSVNQAAVYLTLRRLEGKTLIESTLGEPTPERGGRAKRGFAMTPGGVDRLAQSRRELMSMWEGLPEAFDG